MRYNLARLAPLSNRIGNLWQLIGRQRIGISVCRLLWHLTRSPRLGLATDTDSHNFYFRSCKWIIRHFVFHHILLASRYALCTFLTLIYSMKMPLTGIGDITQFDMGGTTHFSWVAIRRCDGMKLT
ncbi:MAG: hypothetical protein JNJ50_22385 [Acidobacteria bacterium]|nr:hypothetical protein [Acidobacteriota bacterium]